MNTNMVVNSNLEIERKFLVSKDLPELTNGKSIVQAYMFKDERKELRIRISGLKCTISIKIHLNGLVREEYEYDIPLTEGERLIKVATGYPPIEKVRYMVMHDNMRWELDFFEGENEGLVIAEIELNYPDQPFKKPFWIKEEVTSDLRYYNANLFENPYKNWRIRHTQGE